MGAAVFIADFEVQEAVFIALAASIAKCFALHGGHVEGIALVEGPARADLLGESTHLWDFFK